MTRGGVGIHCAVVKVKSTILPNRRNARTSRCIKEMFVHLGVRSLSSKGVVPALHKL